MLGTPESGCFFLIFFSVLQSVPWFFSGFEEKPHRTPQSHLGGPQKHHGSVRRESILGGAADPPQQRHGASPDLGAVRPNSAIRAAEIKNKSSNKSCRDGPTTPRDGPTTTHDGPSKCLILAEDPGGSARGMASPLPFLRLIRGLGSKSKPPGSKPRKGCWICETRSST